MHNDRVSLSGEYLEGIDRERICLDAVRFDDSHAVTVDGEVVSVISERSIDLNPYSKDPMLTLVHRRQQRRGNGTCRR